MKNSCGFGWYKHEEIWFGNLGKWLEMNNKGKRDAKYDKDQSQ